MRISDWSSDVCSSDLSIETGLRYEISRLSQTGDSELSKSLSYFKPRLLLSWAASPRDRLRLQVEREVGQLNFEDFVSSPSLTSGTVTAGNKNLEPDSLVRYEAAWERRLGDGRSEKRRVGKEGVSTGR